MPSTKPIELDGSTLEGGGQLVRVALSLSAITGIPVLISNIRANRAPQGRSKFSGGGSRGQGRDSRSSKPEGGLKESHLGALHWLAKQCNAYVEGGEVGSREVLFVPGAGFSTKSRKKGRNGAEELVDFEKNVIELRNPGSAWLILQAILPFLIFGKSVAEAANGQDEMVELTLRGGTNVSKSMSGEYVQHVLLPILSRIGLPDIDVEVRKRGWAGNASAIGEVVLRMPRSPASGFALPAFEVIQRGEVEKIYIKIVAGENPVENLRIQLTNTIAEHFGNELPVEVLEVEDSGDARRLYVLLVAHTSNGWRLGRDFLGSGKNPKNPSEEQKIVGNACQTVVRDLKNEVKRGGCVDEFMQDQLVIFQALAQGRSCVDGGQDGVETVEDDEECGDDAGSLHTRTVRWVCEKMLRKVKEDVKFQPDGLCQGVGWNEKGPVNAVINPVRELKVEDQI